MATIPASQSPAPVPGTPQSPVNTGSKEVVINPILPNMTDPTAKYISL